MSLLFPSEPLHYDGPGVEMPPPPHDEEANFLLLVKYRFAGLAKCLCRMLRFGLPPAPFLSGCLCHAAGAVSTGTPPLLFQQ